MIEYEDVIHSTCNQTLAAYADKTIEDYNSYAIQITKDYSTKFQDEGTSIGRGVTSQIAEILFSGSLGVWGQAVSAAINSVTDISFNLAQTAGFSEDFRYKTSAKIIEIANGLPESLAKDVTINGEYINSQWDRRVNEMLGLPVGPELQKPSGILSKDLSMLWNTAIKPSAKSLGTALLDSGYHDQNDKLMSMGLEPLDPALKPSVALPKLWDRHVAPEVQALKLKVTDFVADMTPEQRRVFIAGPLQALGGILDLLELAPLLPGARKLVGLTLEEANALTNAAIAATKSTSKRFASKLDDMVPPLGGAAVIADGMSVPFSFLADDAAWVALPDNPNAFFSVTNNARTRAKSTTKTIAAGSSLKALDDAAFKQFYAGGKVIYKDSPKHHVNVVGEISQSPKDPGVIKDSIQIKDTSPRRIAVDRNNDEFVRFDRTLIHADGTHEYHGYTAIWEASHGQNPKLALTKKERALLIKNGLVNKKGEIL